MNLWHDYQEGTLSFGGLLETGRDVIVPLLTGCLAVGLAVGVAGYFLIRLFWPAAAEAKRA
jgi:hypothetical protein